jgi:hypothetical protein
MRWTVDVRQPVTTMIVVFILGVLSACELLQESVPVRCSRRESFFGNGYVVKVENQSDKTLSLWIESGDKKTDFTLAPRGSEEFGWLEGFHFGDNSSYSVGGEGYSTLKFEPK